MKTFGIWDSQDKCWMGRDKGPLQYEDETMARVAAVVVNEMFKTFHRFRAVPYDGSGVKLKDTLEADFTGAEAIARIEARV